MFGNWSPVDMELLFEIIYWYCRTPIQPYLNYVTGIFQKHLRNSEGGFQNGNRYAEPFRLGYLHTSGHGRIQLSRSAVGSGRSQTKLYCEMQRRMHPMYSTQNMQRRRSKMWRKGTWDASRLSTWWNMCTDWLYL